MWREYYSTLLQDKCNWEKNDLPNCVTHTQLRKSPQMAYDLTVKTLELKTSGQPLTKAAFRCPVGHTRYCNHIGNSDTLWR